MKTPNTKHQTPNLFARVSLLAPIIVALMFALGWLALNEAVLIAATIQLSAFMVAAPQPRLFTTALTPEQIEEFKNILKELEGFKGVLADSKTLIPGLKDLAGIEGGFAMLKELPKALKELKTEFQKQGELLNTYRKLQIGMKTSINTRRGEVSEDCARHLAGLAFVARLRSGKSIDNRDRMEGMAKEILGVEAKTALTTSDIPLPTEFSGMVVELVSTFGTARQFGTVYPLGAGTVKLPKLTTDTQFGLIASSGTVTEKSPAFAFVTFAAEKFGGLVRVPSELDEDSIVGLGQFIARYSARQIANIEDVNFWTSSGAGSGVNGTAEGLTKNTITNSKVTQMASTKTHYSDATLANLRTLRTVVDAAVLRRAAYFAHPTFEQLFSTFNSAGDRPYNPTVQLTTGAYPVGQVTGPTLDGFPIFWIDVLPAYSTSVNASKVFILFGDPSYQYLGIRGGVRFDTSADAAFTTDEILVRALERFTVGLMATGAVSGLETAAS